MVNDFVYANTYHNINSITLLALLPSLDPYPIRHLPALCIPSSTSVKRCGGSATQRILRSCTWWRGKMWKGRGGGFFSGGWKPLSYSMSVCVTVAALTAPPPCIPSSTSVTRCSGSATRNILRNSFYVYNNSYLYQIITTCLRNIHAPKCLNLNVKSWTPINHRLKQLSAKIEDFYYPLSIYYNKN